MNNQNAISWFTYVLYGWLKEWIKRGLQEYPQKIAALCHNMIERKRVK